MKSIGINIVLKITHTLTRAPEILPSGGNQAKAARLLGITRQAVSRSVMKFLARLDLVMITNRCPRAQFLKDPGMARDDGPIAAIFEALSGIEWNGQDAGSTMLRRV